jgi:hypothetical protein
MGLGGDLPMLIGPYALLVASLITVRVLWKKVNDLYEALDNERAERLRDAKDSQALAEAYLKLRREDGKNARGG